MEQVVDLLKSIENKFATQLKTAHFRSVYHGKQFTNRIKTQSPWRTCDALQTVLL